MVQTRASLHGCPGSARRVISRAASSVTRRARPARSALSRHGVSPRRDFAQGYLGRGRLGARADRGARATPRQRHDRRSHAPVAPALSRGHERRDPLDALMRHRWSKISRPPWLVSERLSWESSRTTTNPTNRKSPRHSGCRGLLFFSAVSVSVGGVLALLCYAAPHVARNRAIASEDLRTTVVDVESIDTKRRHGEIPRLAATPGGRRRQSFEDVTPPISRSRASCPSPEACRAATQSTLGLP